MRKCRHDRDVVGYSFVNGNWVVEAGLATPGRVDCAHCGVALPLGPATMTPEVEVELRAAEIAALAMEWPRTQSIEGAIATTNIGGPKTEAAVLARCILEHEEES